MAGRSRTRGPWGGWVLLLLLFFLPASAAPASDVFFPDISAASPNGRFRLDAKSPDNVPGASQFGPPRFQKDFQYVLRAVPGDKVLWRREQPKDEGSPIALYIGNDGWSVVRTFWSELILMGPEGRQTGKIKTVSFAKTKDEKDALAAGAAAGTMAGPLGRDDHAYLISHGGKPYFVLRAYSDRRFVIDMEKGRLISMPTDLPGLLDAAEKEFVLATLRKAGEKQQACASDCPNSWTVSMAVHMATRMRMQEAIPLLRQMEESEYIGSHVLQLTRKGYEMKEGEVDLSRWDEYTYRREAQTALRRLGEKPRSFPAVRLVYYDKDWATSDPYVPKPLERPREEQARLVKKGMSAMKVLELLGVPDYPDKSEWSYDVDADPPYTLTVVWGKRTVKRVQKVKPPFWQEESEGE